MYIHSQKKNTQSYSSGGTQLLVERGEPMHVNYTDYLKLLGDLGRALASLKHMCCSYI